nr:MAG TPA: GCS1 Male gamete fusion factor [Caudoviricetes sp.]
MYHFADCDIIGSPFFFDWWQPPFCSLVFRQCYNNTLIT